MLSTKQEIRSAAEKLAKYLTAAYADVENANCPWSNQSPQTYIWQAAGEPPLIKYETISFDRLADH